MALPVLSIRDQTFSILPYISSGGDSDILSSPNSSETLFKIGELGCITTSAALTLAAITFIAATFPATSYYRATAKTGGIGGAIVGAGIGHLFSDSAKGALIGAAIGSVAGVGLGLVAAHYWWSVNSTVNLTLISGIGLLVGGALLCTSCAGLPFTFLMNEPN